MVYWLRPPPHTAPAQERSKLALPSRDLARLDDQAFAELYEHYYDRVVRYIAARTGSRDAVEEMAGDVFVRALESLDTIQERGIPPGAWLFRVAHNQVVDHHRKRARRRGVPLEEASNVAGVSNPAEEVEHLLTNGRGLPVHGAAEPGAAGGARPAVHGRTQLRGGRGRHGPDQRGNS